MFTRRHDIPTDRWRNKPKCLGRSALPGRILPHAFTLVELLVVIAIFAVLLAILLPALSKARENAKALVCLSNIRQYGIAWELYGGDNKGWCPTAYNANNAWFYVLPLYTNSSSLSAGQFVSYDTNRLHCTERLPPYSGVTYRIGIGYNVWFGVFFSDGTPYLNTAQRRQERITNGATTFLFTDCWGYLTKPGPGWVWFNAPDEEFLLRHGENGNGVFADGHGASFNTYPDVSLFGVGN